MSKLYATEFREYQYVLRHTERAELLRNLYHFPIAGAAVQAVADDFVKDHRLPKVRIDLTGRNAERGNYYRRWQGRGPRIVIARQTRAEYVAHELAHHWTFNLTGATPPPHGADFVQRLDMTADWLAPRLGVAPGVD